MGWIKHGIGYMPDDIVCDDCAGNEALVTRWLKMQPNYTYYDHAQSQAAIARNTLGFRLRQNLIRLTATLRPQEKIQLANTEIT